MTKISELQISTSPNNVGAFTGALDLTKIISGTVYDDYDVGLNGTITFSVGTSNSFGWAYVKVISDGTTPFITEANLGAIFTESVLGIPPDYILPAGTYPLYFWKTPTGVGISSPNTSSSIATAGVAPTLVSAVVSSANLNELILTFSKAVTLTSGAGFSLGGTTDTSFASVAGSGTSTITATVTNAFVATETVTLAYNSGTGNVVATDDGTPLESIVSFNVTISDATAPVVQNISIGSLSDSIIRIAYDETLANVVPLVGDFAITYDGVSKAATAVAVSTYYVDVTVGEAATPSTVILISYVQSAGAEIQDSSGNKAANFSGSSVTNQLNLGNILLKANSTDVIVTTGGVDSWQDVSGNNKDAVTGSTPRPVLSAALVNAKDAVTFGGDAWMDISDNNLWDNNNGMTIIMVARKNGTVGFMQTYYNESVNPNSFYEKRGFSFSSTGFTMSENHGDVDSSGVTHTLADSAWAIIVLRWLPFTETASFINGTKAVAPTTSKGCFYNSPEKEPTILGATRNTAGPGSLLNGDIAYVKNIKKAFSNGEIKNAIDSLKADYGLTIDTSAIIEQTPVFSSAIIGQPYNDKLRIYFTNVMSIDSNVVAADFTLSGITPTISSIEVGINYVQLNLSAEGASADTVTVAYSGTGLKSPLGNTVATFTAQAVTNAVLDDSTATIVIDNRIAANVTQVAGAFLENKVTTLTDKIGGIPFTRTSTTAEARYKLSHKGIRTIMPLENTGVLQSWEAATAPQIYSNTNGMTAFLVINPRNSSGKTLLGKYIEYDSRKEFSVSTGEFSLMVTTGGGTVVTYTLPENKISVLVVRWTPSTEQTAFVNGVQVTPNTAPLASLTPSTAKLTLNDFRSAGGGTSKSDFYYVSAYNSALTNAEVKAQIDKLGAAFDVTVDTSGIV